MRRWLGRHWQIALVAVLFLASTGALAATATGVFLLPQLEASARDRIQKAASEIALASEPLLEQLPADAPTDDLLPAPLHRRLSLISRGLLSGHSETEGGFYVGGRIDQFLGFSGPPAPHGRPDPKKAAEKKKEPDPESERRDPPPVETPMILSLSQQALLAPPDSEPLVEVADVGPARIAVATAAVGAARPARMAVWIMTRLSDPERQRSQLRGFFASAGLALCGVILAAALLFRLSGSLRRERDERERLADELRKAEHLASLGGLLAGVAHEVRNPLAAIRSTVQLWERLPDQSRTPASLAAVVAAIDQLNSLVGRLLFFARSAHEERRDIDLASIVAESIELCSAQASEAEVQFENWFDHDLPPVSGAPQALRQVVLNLLSNAIQETPRGGWIRCRVRRNGGDVELTVSDSGPGVPPDLRQRIFEPFFTTRTDGTGLGLALCREIVVQHDGSIELLPASAAGAIFRVSLPAAPPDQED